jgi:hypothetical protein
MLLSNIIAMCVASLTVSRILMTELDQLVHRNLGFSGAMQVADALAARVSADRYKLAEVDMISLWLSASRTHNSPAANRDSPLRVE